MRPSKKEQELIKVISDRSLFVTRDVSRLQDPAYTQAISRDEFTDEVMALADQLQEIYVRSIDLQNETADQWGRLPDVK